MNNNKTDELFLILIYKISYINTNLRILQSNDLSYEEVSSRIYKSIYENETLSDILVENGYTNYLNISFILSSQTEFERDVLETQESWFSRNVYKIYIQKTVVIILIIVIALIIIIAIAIVSLFIFKTKEIVTNPYPIKVFFNNIQNKQVTPELDVYDPHNKDKIVCEGYIFKEGRHRTVLKYQKRYAVLYSNPPVFKLYENIIPSLYGNVFMNEKQSAPMDSFTDIIQESHNQFILKFKVVDCELKHLSKPTEDEMCVERIYRLRCEPNKLSEWLNAFKNYKSNFLDNKVKVVWNEDCQIVFKEKSIAVLENKEIKYIKTNYVAGENQIIDGIFL